MTREQPTVRTDYVMVSDLGDHDQVLAVALASIEAAGCSCNAEVALWRAEHRIEIRHDDWCPVMEGNAA